jgi:hypothetical protein
VLLSSLPPLYRLRLVGYQASSQDAEPDNIKRLPAKVKSRRCGIDRQANSTAMTNLGKSRAEKDIPGLFQAISASDFRTSKNGPAHPAHHTAGRALPLYYARTKSFPVAQATLSGQAYGFDIRGPSGRFDQDHTT